MQWVSLIISWILKLKCWLLGGTRIDVELHHYIFFIHSDIPLWLHVSGWLRLAFIWVWVQLWYVLLLIFFWIGCCSACMIFWISDNPKIVFIRTLNNWFQVEVRSTLAIFCGYYAVLLVVAGRGCPIDLPIDPRLFLLTPGLTAFGRKQFSRTDVIWTTCE